MHLLSKLAALAQQRLHITGDLGHVFVDLICGIPAELDREFLAENVERRQLGHGVSSFSIIQYAMNSPRFCDLAPRFVRLASATVRFPPGICDGCLEHGSGTS